MASSLPDDCLTLTVVQTVISEDTAGGYVFLAFLLFLLFGLLCGCLLLRWIFREIETSNTRKQEYKAGTCVVELPKDSPQNSDDEEPVSREASKVFLVHSRVSPMPPATPKGSEIFTSTGTLLDKTEISKKKTTDTSLIQALIKNNGEEMDVEIHNQDFRSVLVLERQFQTKKTTVMLELLKLILHKLFSSNWITDVFKRDMVAKYEQAVEDIENNNEMEKAEKENELKKKTKNPQELEEALELLHGSYVKKTEWEISQLQDQLHKDLKEHSGLSQEEIDGIMAKLSKNLAAAEKAYASEAERQALALHEKLANRQAMAQKRAAQQKQEKEIAIQRRKEHYNILNKLVKDGRIMEQQKDRLMAQYEENLSNMEYKHKQEVFRHQLELSEKLKRKREHRMRKLADQQEKVKEDFMKESTMDMEAGQINLEEFVQHEAALLQRQDEAVEQLELSLDQKEADALDKLSETWREKYNEAVTSVEESLFEQLKAMAKMTKNEADRLMREHEQQVEKVYAKQQEEKEKQNKILQEKLAQRKERWVRETERQKVEQAELIDQQEKTIGLVLQAQVGLTEEMKDKVMQEHEQNLVSLNNHLQMSRLRQQKRLEQRLAEKKSRLASLKTQQEEERNKQVTGDPESMETLIKSQNIEYQAEIAKVEAEHQEALDQLRSRMNKETEDALEEQDKKLGEMLSKLQLSHQRREEIIRKQDEAIKALESKIVDTVIREGTFAENATEKLLRQHQRQVDELNENIRRSKEDQLKKIRDKLEAKKLRKERMLEDQLKEEAKQKKKKGAQSAANTVSTLLAEQRHNQKLEEVKRELDLEFIQHRQELEKEMDHQLSQDLQEHEKNFITQLATVSKMSEKELLNTIKSTSAEFGTDEQVSKTLVKDLRKRIKSARTETGKG